jgi:hypothetical protein
MTLSTKRTRIWRGHAPIGVATLAALTLTVAAVVSTAVADGQPAHAARATAVKEEANLHLTGRTGNSLSEQGSVTGTLSGTATATISTSGESVKVTAVLHLSGGTITVQGEGQLNSTHGTEVSFKAPGSVKNGTGAYKHASGKGTVYGSENRVTHSARIQVIGRLNT